ncbi:hypothetical protein J7M22_00155 [Candidatus Poribacteria bacterium]|nr:hypothetical protein [Candidatus Poribacteria bacterium]
MAGFITAILINGLSRYYFLTGDERLPEAIDRAVTFLDNDTWREEWRDWRYTSCPASRATGRGRGYGACQRFSDHRQSGTSPNPKSRLGG